MEFFKFTQRSNSNPNLSEDNLLLVPRENIFFNKGICKGVLVISGIS